MSDIYVLKADARERVGKGSARELRRNGRVPAVIYGAGESPLSISLDYNEMFHKIHGGHFLTSLANIELDGKTHKVLPKDYQLDPVRDFPIHVDFLRVSSKTVVTVEVPVHFTNEEASPGLEQGGVLNVVRHSIELNCPADSIPESIIVDLTGVELGSGIHFSDVSLPQGATPTITDRDFTIATIATPAALKSDEELAEEEEALETEVIEQGDENVEDDSESKGGEDDSDK